MNMVIINESGEGEIPKSKSHIIYNRLHLT